MEPISHLDRTKLAFGHGRGSWAGSLFPVVWPLYFSIGAESQDRFNCECHSRFACSHGLVLRMVRDRGRRVEFRVDTVAAPGLDNDKTSRSCVLFDDPAKVLNRCTWFEYLNGLV